MQKPKANEAKNDIQSSVGDQWGYVKHKIGEFSRTFGSKLKRERESLKNQLERDLYDLNNNLTEENKIKYENLKFQYDDLINYQIKGSILRSLSENYEEGEKCSKYFYSLEKHRAKQRTICRLERPNGDIISDQKLILEDCRLFYENLYKNNPEIQLNQRSYFFESPHIPKVNQHKAQECDKILTLTELHQSLKKFNKNKAPGIDGLSAELYLTFWNQLGPLLLDVFNETYELGILPQNMRVGVITLLEKKGKDRLKIDNWRPITLLGVDYKILTKCLGERLKKILPDLVHPDQNGFVPGRNIFYSTHTIRDLLFYCEKENIDMIRFCVDYTKAFDSLEFSFIKKALDLYDFVDGVKKSIEILFRGREIRI